MQNRAPLKKHQFTVYEPLYGRKVICFTKDTGIFKQLSGLWGKRVAVDGMIKYSADGVALALLVDKITEFGSDSGPCDFNLYLGILKEYA